MNTLGDVKANFKKKEYRIEDNLIDEYFQKSRKFLYPIVSPNLSVVPIQTYIAWKDHYTTNDNRLICLYDLSNELAFKQFEKCFIKHELFETYKEMEDNKIIYIFNFSKHEKDMDHFHKGLYSYFSDGWKEIILNYYTPNKESWKYIDSFLNPVQYFEKYAELLNVREELLWRVGELCNPFNLEKETLCLNQLNKVINSEKLLLF